MGERTFIEGSSPQVCKKCGSCMKPVLSHTIEASEFYCRECHKSYPMDKDSYDAMLAAYSTQMKGRSRG